MVLVVSMTPVMYTDYSGHSAKFLNNLALCFSIVAATAAVVVGAGVLLGLTAVCSPLFAVALVVAGANILMKTAVVAQAQYNQSVKDGDGSSEIFSDVINSAGDYTIRKSLSKIVGIPVLNFLKTGGVEMYNMVGDILFTGYGNKFKSYVPKVGYSLAGAQTGWVAGRTFLSMTDTEYCFDYAESLGWRPYED